MVAEQTLIGPAFRCFALLDETIDEQQKLIANILSYQSEFVPYLGKNECSLWWENAAEVSYSQFVPDGPFKIDSLFVKSESVKESKVEEPLFDILMDGPDGNTFSFFENLPIGYLGSPLFQYEYRSFAFTDWDLSFRNNKSGNLIQLKTNSNEVIQLF